MCMRTFRHLDAFDRFVIDCSRAFLDELVAFYAKIDYFCALDGILDQLHDHIVDDISGEL